jgi:hypothetical protein
MGLRRGISNYSLIGTCRKLTNKLISIVLEHLWCVDEPRATFDLYVATLLWPSVRMKLTLPKVGDLESSGTPKSLEFDNKGQNTSPWGVLGVIGNVLKCRCP